METDAGFEAFRKSLIVENRIKVVFSALLFCLGVYLLTSAVMIYQIIGVFPLMAGTMFLFPALQEFPIKKNPMMQLLEEEPEKIVWVYSIVVERMPFGLKVFSQSTLYFKLIDRGEYSVGIPEKYIDVVTRMLNKKLRHATFGFSQEKEQWYIASPELLINYGDE